MEIEREKREISRQNIQTIKIAAESNLNIFLSLLTRDTNARKIPNQNLSTDGNLSQWGLKTTIYGHKMMVLYQNDVQIPSMFQFINYHYILSSHYFSFSPQTNVSSYLIQNYQIIREEGRTKKPTSDLTLAVYFSLIGATVRKVAFCLTIVKRNLI